MNETNRLLHRFLEQRQYRVLEDEPGYVVVRYQLSSIHVWTGENHFVTVAVSGFEEVTPSNFHEVLVRCNKINRDMKLVKVYTLKDTIVAAGEFYYHDEYDFEQLLLNAMNGVIDAKGRYYRLKIENT